MQRVVINNDNRIREKAKVCRALAWKCTYSTAICRCEEAASRSV